MTTKVNRYSGNRRFGEALSTLWSCSPCIEFGDVHVREDGNDELEGKKEIKKEVVVMRSFININLLLLFHQYKFKRQDI